MTAGGTILVDMLVPIEVVRLWVLGIVGFSRSGSSTAGTLAMWEAPCLNLDHRGGFSVLRCGVSD
jgi:hypothetical protein